MTDLPDPALTAEMLVDDLPFSVRILNAFKNDGIKTVADVARLTDSRIIRTPNLGPVSLREIRALIPRWIETPSRRDERCGRCKYWDGKCHRYAPRTQLPDTFPRTAPGDWCGNFSTA